MSWWPPGRAPTQPAARFWLDRETGLVLRREVYDESGRITRASAFVEITVGEADGLQRRRTVGEGHATGRVAWPTRSTRPRLQRMRDHGWHCPDKLPPSLQLVDARRGGGEYDGIVHLSYSDGLASRVGVRAARAPAGLRPRRLPRHDGRRPQGLPPRRRAAAAGLGVARHRLHGGRRRIGAYGGRRGRGLPPTDRGHRRHAPARPRARPVASWFNPFG